MGRKPHPLATPERSGSAVGMEENMKKAVAEMLVLFLLSEREMYIGEIPEELEKRSDGRFRIVFPYSVIYRMEKFDYIEELKKRIAPDGRKRQYYGITKKGKAYLTELCNVFEQFTGGVNTILASRGGQEKKSQHAEVQQSDKKPANVQLNETTTDDEDQDNPEFSGRLAGCIV
ncbi:MAG: PadR family transcriptional regulator [Eubacteriales bacterium]|nr:PadR family transcriptional regulator [Eubacteriales bacterium]